MPQYVIERDIPNAGQLTDAELRAVSLKSMETLGALGPQIQWLHSYVTESKVYCVYLAPDEATVQEHARRTGIPGEPDFGRGLAALLDPVNVRCLNEFTRSTSKASATASSTDSDQPCIQAAPACCGARPCRAASSVFSRRSCCGRGKGVASV